MAQNGNMQRPLSPHIQIYRWTLTMTLSILHRATGVALYAGTALLAWWLIAVASGPEAYAQVQTVSSHWVGRLVLFWDTGRGFDLPTVERLARLSAVLPVLLTLGAWVAAYKYLGVL
jgi:succinate dehydrogenase / fumarate reductase cytochrome b subunit